jgi:hypothetical protein
MNLVRVAIASMIAIGLASAQTQNSSVAPERQSQPARPLFAAASIKPDAAPERAGILRPIPGTLTAENVSVKSYIQWAWNNHVKRAEPPAHR